MRYWGYEVSDITKGTTSTYVNENQNGNRELNRPGFFGCVKFLAVLRYKGIFLRSILRQHIALRWSAGRILSISIDISRLWREEGFISQQTSLLQRSRATSGRRTFSSRRALFLNKPLCSSGAILLRSENRKRGALLSHSSGVLCPQTL